MNPLLVLLQVAAVALLLCLVHAAKPRIGTTPFYMVVGMLVVMLFVIGDFGFRVDVPLLWGQDVPLDTALLLPLILTAQVMVYVLEGSRAARRLVVGIVLVQLLHHGLDLLVVWNATQGGGRLGPTGLEGLPTPDVGQRLASMAAFVADFVVLIVSYQFMVNRLAWLPDFLRLSFAMLFAMGTDALIYGAVFSRLGGEGLFPLVEKVQCVAAAALPTSAYLWLGLRHGRASALGGRQRRALDVIDLRALLAQTEARLEDTERRFEDIKDVFSRYVSPEVVSRIVDDPSKLALGGEEREVTVLFADIAGYSTLSEVLSPTEIIGLLNQYFERMTAPILDRHGMINEFEGDGILAIFGAPLDLPGHADEAVGAARAMLDAVEALNADWAADGTLDRWRDSGVERLAIRIGVHTGTVVAGNVGSEARIKYAVIGDTVNVASRVEALNKTLGTPMLLTGQTARSLGESGPALQPMGAHVVKGRVEPVEVFTLGA